LENIDLIERYCCREDLSSYDPYDIWKTRLGFSIKALFYRHRFLGYLPAAGLSVFDAYLNNRLRFFYARQEYPIVRAIAALTLLNLYQATRADRFLTYAKLHLDWLEANSCQGFHGHCWGLGFKHVVSKDIRYLPDTPLVTITPYVLEAFAKWFEKAPSESVGNIIESIGKYLIHDLQPMRETSVTLASSYGPWADRIVVNASSYAMFSHALVAQHIADPETKELHLNRARKLYTFIRDQQREDGSWFYSPEGKSFIDTFHSCIVVKNIFKTERLIFLPEAETVAKLGYRFIAENLWDRKKGLAKRFALKNKPSLILYDLYDNSEFASLSILLGEMANAEKVLESANATFVENGDIFSQIVWPGWKINKDCLRWAVMPYLYALSLQVKLTHEQN